MKRNVRPRLQRARWLIPLSYASAALAVGIVFPRFEHHYLPSLVTTVSPAAAMSVASSVASGMIALTGIVFSLTFVMVQFSATAYSPRLVLWVSRDPVMGHALGVFSSTFLYALIFLAWVDRNASGRVPLISYWMVIGLLLASVGMFIALIERIGLLQINRMLIFTGDRGRKAIEDLYAPSGSVATREVSLPAGLAVTQTLTHFGRPMIIQGIHVAELVELARRSDAIIEMAAAVGDTVMEMSTLLRVYGGHQPLDESALKSAIKVGDERTFEQDPKYAIRLVVDIAIKALSPAINDPTTAVQALDQIEDLLLRLGRHRLEIGTFHDNTGRLRVLVSFPTWDDFLRLALDEIQSYGADSVQVMRRMKALIKNLANVLPVERQASVRHWERRLQGSIARSFADDEHKREASVADRQGLGTSEPKT